MAVNSSAVSADPQVPLRLISAIRASATGGSPDPDQYSVTARPFRPLWPLVLTIPAAPGQRRTHRAGRGQATGRARARSEAGPGPGQGAPELNSEADGAQARPFSVRGESCRFSRTIPRRNA